jgi:uncharacterized protein (DUF1800 family)
VPLSRSPHIEHLLRRAGFGARADELELYGSDLFATAAGRLLNFSDVPDDVDAKIGAPGYVAVTTRGQFSPNTVITDARQRWLFRMVHTNRPLQEKMALFWHNHFATAYSKIAGIIGAAEATRYMAAKPSEDRARVRGQIELFREYALGNFRDLLVELSKDTAMLFWLDGYLNTRVQPQENFGREIMELFTLGVGHYTEEDVYAAARVFTGWNLRLVGNALDTAGYYEFAYIPNNHDPTAKTFTFPIYPDGSKTIPARAASAGLQDGIDFINALATHPATAERLARKLWNFFISEAAPPDPDYLRGATGIYRANDTRILPLVQYTLQSRWFQNPGNWHTRYAWPVEFAVRAVKEVGFLGYTVDNMRTPLIAMGQTLFEPPDVNGWELGQGWFSTGGMLARMNFASALASNQKFNLAIAAGGANSSPDTFMNYFLGRLSPAPYEAEPLETLKAYLTNGGAWTGAAAQLQTKGAGLTRLIVGSAEYQLM